MNTRLSLLAGTAALGLVALSAPASAVPVGIFAPSVTSQAGVVPIYYRRYYGGPRAYYRPRRSYVYRSYDYDDSYPVVRTYRYGGYGGNPYYGGYGSDYGYGGEYGGGYYSGGPSIGFSFGGF